MPSQLPDSLSHTYTSANKCITEYFKTYIASQQIHTPTLLSAIEYSLLNGGKRLRPLLVFLTGEMLNVDNAALSPVALAVECIHAYSLVHDDLPAMDDDDLRRGQATCHIKYDEATAILAGDALQTMAFELIAKIDEQSVNSTTKIELIKLLSSAAGLAGMVGGQSLDLQATNKQIDLDQLSTLHKMKTGAMIRVSVMIACALKSDMSERHKQCLENFATCIGLAFQIQDDILDVTADTDTLGKPQGSDVDANKSTFVSLLGLDGAVQALDEQYMQAVNALDDLPYNTDKLRELANFIVKRAY